MSSLSSRPGCRFAVAGLTSEVLPLSVGRLFSSFTSTFNVLLRGPSSFFAMSNFIITSRSTVFASARAHDPLSRSSRSPVGGTSDASPLRRRLKVCKNSARFDASFRARFRPRRSEIDLLICTDSVSCGCVYMRQNVYPPQLVNGPLCPFRHEHNPAFVPLADVQVDLRNLVVPPTVARPLRLFKLLLNVYHARAQRWDIPRCLIANRAMHRALPFSPSPDS